MSLRSTRKRKKAKRDFIGANFGVIITDCTCSSEPTLSRGNSDQVVWSSGDGGSYAVVFYPDPPDFPYGSPFHDAVFVVGPDRTTSSGPPRHDAEYSGYKYRVVGDNGCDIDPIIHIGP